MFHRSILLYGKTMRTRCVPFVMIPSIFWKLLMKFIHIIITVCLSKDRSTGDGKIFSVAFNNALVCNFFPGGRIIFREPVAIYQKEFRFKFKFGNGEIGRA